MGLFLDIIRCGQSIVTWTYFTILLYKYRTKLECRKFDTGSRGLRNLYK